MDSLDCSTVLLCTQSKHVVAADETKQVQCPANKICNVWYEVRIAKHGGGSVVVIQVMNA